MLKRIIFIRCLMVLTMLWQFAFAEGLQPALYQKDSGDTLLFFGYDLSQLKLIDRERELTGFRPYHSALVDYLEQKITNNRVSNITKSDTVIFDFGRTRQINAESARENAVRIPETLLSEKSLELMVSQYLISGYHGKGYVLIFDRFDRAYHEVTVHLVLFDIDSGKLLCSHRITSESGHRHSTPEDWYYSAYVAAVRAIKNIVIWDRKGCDALKDSTRIREMKEFRPGIFRNDYEELPFTFGFNPILGISNTGISGGVHLSGDVYHVLFGVRALRNPLLVWGDESRNETAIYLGYRYRKKKNSFSVGSGWGWVEYFCTSGLNSDCEQYKEETLRSIPLHVEYAYCPKPMFGFSFAIDAGFTSRTPNIGIFAGIKIGIFGHPKKWAEEE